MRITPRHLAFLKISEGCNRACTFCSIPQMRGKHASKPIEDVVAEAKELVADGAGELIVVAQDTTFYGIDIYGKPRLDDLLRQLEQIEGLQWIRLMYFYPMYVTDELLGVIAGSDKILPYIDIPLQHIDDDVLRRMRRATTRDKTEALLDRLRDRIPRLAKDHAASPAFRAKRKSSSAGCWSSSSGVSSSTRGRSPTPGADDACRNHGRPIAR